MNIWDKIALAVWAFNLGMYFNILLKRLEAGFWELFTLIMLIVSIVMVMIYIMK